MQYSNVIISTYYTIIEPTGIITELSYRFIETPIRKRTLGASIARVWRSPVPGPRNAMIGVGAVVGALTFVAVNLFVDVLTTVIDPRTRAKQ